MNETESQPTPDDALVPAHKPAAWQFSLWSLFELTTAASIAAALVEAKGWGTLVLSIGFTIVWFNVRGSFACWQTPRGQAWFFGAAWVLFGVSLALPVLHVFSSYDYGWQAAEMMAVSEWENFVKFFTPDVWSTKQIIIDLVWLGWLTLINATNLLMIFSPVTLWRLRRGKGERLATK